MSEIYAVTVPKWGLSMEEGQLDFWHVAEGDAVEEGDDLVDIETPKITNTHEAPHSGILRRRIGEEGESYPCGALIGVIADADAPDNEIDVFVQDFVIDVAESDESAEEQATEPETREVGDCRFRYLKMGKGEIPVVFFHGFGGDLNNWMFVQPRVSGAASTIALDLPGHGGSNKDVGTGSAGDLADMCNRFLQDLGENRIHIVGHSFGAAVALVYALAYPDQVASITLIAPAGFGREINQAYIDGFIEGRRRRELAATLEMLLSDKSLVTREMVDDIIRYKRIDGVESALRAMAEASFADGKQMIDLRGRLQDLKTPLLVIWGEDDEIIPATHADGLEGLAKVEVISGVGHMPHLEAPGRVADLINDHISAQRH